MAKKMFVGNLSFQTTESDIRAAFEQYGSVESVAIITDRDTGRSKGFGFVEMSEEDANKAIAGLGGSELDGRALTVNEAKPMVKRDFGGGGGGRGGSGGGGGRGGNSRGGGGGRY
jgi:RNA recognition motif-containing protein